MMQESWELDEFEDESVDDSYRYRSRTRLPRALLWMGLGALVGWSLATFRDGWQRKEIVVQGDDGVFSHDDTPGSCRDVYEGCRPGYFGHWSSLMAGEALCNGHYRVELTVDGRLQWRDCKKRKGVVFYEPPAHGPSVGFFQLEEHGALRLVSTKNETIWYQESNRHIEASLHCNSDPSLDCPYMHLHKDSGALILNWISHDRFTGHNFDEIYPELYE